MNWFKVVLLGYFGMQIAVSIYQAGKGSHDMKITPAAQILSAIINGLFLAGALAYF